MVAPLILLRYLIIFLLLTPSAWAQVTCDPQKMSGVSVKWNSEPLKFNHSRSSGQLNNYDIDTKSPYARHVKTDVGGLMSGEIAIKSNFNFSLLRYPSAQETCLWFDNVQISIEIDPTIYIANDHKKGSCRYQAIKHHEMKHVYVDRKLVQKYTRKIKLRVEKALKNVGVVGPRPDHDVARVQKKMQKYLEDALGPVVDAMYEERARLQQNVDSLEEYERVKDQCHDHATSSNHTHNSAYRR